MLNRLLAGALAVSCVVAPAAAKKLNIGDDAPDLKHVTWLKGEPVSEYRDGQIYVLDFWATWCGPCIASIPHINELQEKHADDGVNVIAVAIWPSPQMTPTADFVEARGDGMNYRVAEDIDRKTADAYMAAAGRNGIPTVMVVDRTGKLAWMGHPMSGLDDVLETMVQGDFDPVAFAEIQRREEQKRAELQRKAQPLLMEMSRAWQAESWSDAAATADKLLALDDDQFSQFAIYKYIALANDEQAEEAAKWGAQAASSLFAENAGALNEFAWAIVSEGSPIQDGKADFNFAATLAEKAAELTERDDADVLDTLALAYFRGGNVDKAIETQRAAVALAEGELKGMLTERLEMFERALSEN